MAGKRQKGQGHPTTGSNRAASQGPKSPGQRAKNPRGKMAIGRKPQSGK